MPSLESSPWHRMHVVCSGAAAASTLAAVLADETDATASTLAAVLAGGLRVPPAPALAAVLAGGLRVPPAPAPAPGKEEARQPEPLPLLSLPPELVLSGDELA